MNNNQYRNTVRIPNLPIGKIVDDNGKATDEELTFRQALLTLLQNLFGEEGLVMPSQTSANITEIQNNQTSTEGASDNPYYTCAPGTIIYDTTTNEVKIAVLVAGVPTFKVVTLT